MAKFVPNYNTLGKANTDTNKVTIIPYESAFITAASAAVVAAQATSISQSYGNT